MLFICCGNHDVVRGKEMPAIKTHIDSLKTILDLNSFASDPTQFNASLENISNYIDIEKEIYQDASDEIHTLYTTHKRNFKGKIVGIATINTSWRAYSDNDNKNLLYPPIFLERAIDSLQDVDLKIILMHHPLSHLKDFNYYELENLVYDKFQFLFAGHTHMDRIETQITGDEGIFCCVSPATLTYGYVDSKIGFTIVEINDDNFYEIRVVKYLYDKVGGVFYSSKSINVHVPIEEEKQEIIKLKNTSRILFKKYNDEANDLLLSSYDNDNRQKEFLDLFTTPSLRTKSKTEITSSKDTGDNFDLKNLQKNNSYIIFGKSKSGRSSILFKILLDLLSDFPLSKCLPLYIDCKEYITNDRRIDIVKLLSRIYQVNYKVAGDMTRRYHIKLLIDNYNSELISFTSDIENFVTNNDASVVICMEESVLRSFDHTKVLQFEYSSLYIHDISRKNMRSLVKKWSNLSDQSEEVLLDKIQKVFKQLNVQFNFWSVSLFLWIFERTKNVTLNNNVELIQLYVDELLDKSGLAINRKINIKFEELKTYLAHLSVFFLEKANGYGYSASYPEIIEFTKTYRDNNIRFVVEVEDLFQLLKTKGIIIKSTNDEYTFRLNGVFEYFIAFYMKGNRDFKNSILTDVNYLSFGNELELYAGFEGNDAEFIKDIFRRTQEIYSATNIRYGSAQEIDGRLVKKFQDYIGVKITINSLRQQFEEGMDVLDPNEKDEMMDEIQPINGSNEEVKLKRNYTQIESSFENLEKSLRILSRVFRNSSLDNIGLSKSLLDYILLSSCHLGFLILDTVNDDYQSPSMEDKDREKGRILLQLTTRFMPLIVNTFLSDALAQENLERLLKDKISELKTEDNNEFQLMLLYFLLIDVNPLKGIKYINELVQSINMGILRQTILMKLYTYLVFFSHGDKIYQQELKNSIKDLHILIDPKSGSNISKRIDGLVRQSLLEKNKNT